MRVFLRDLTLSLRLAFKRPAWTAVIVLTLGLGIGVNSAIFSLYNAAVLRPLPVRDVERLNLLQKSSKEGLRNSFSYAEYAYLRDHNRAFSTLVAHSWDRLSLADESTGQVEEVSAVTVSASYFRMLTSSLLIGRGFSDRDEKPGSDPVVILSHRFWERRCGANGDIVGKSVLLNERSFTVVGVCSKTFRGLNLHIPDVFVPLAARTLLRPASVGQADGRLQLFAIRSVNVTIPQAEAQINSVAAALRETYPGPHQEWKLVLGSPQTNGPATFELAIVMSAVGLVLLIACVNVSNLILARASSRRKEFAVRASLGASRSRLVRLCLAESLVFSVLGGGLGVLTGHWMGNSLLAVTEVLTGVVLTPDWRVFAHALLLSVLSVLICGLSPALHGTRLNVSEVLKEESIVAGTHARSRRSLLVVSQVAASLSLLIVATLFLTSLYHARYADSGISADSVIQVGLERPADGKDRESQRIILQDELVARLRTVPGIDSVSLSINVPCGDRSAQERLAGDIRATVNHVSAGYFRVLGMRVLKGRDFTNEETQIEAHSAIVSESLAARLWPGRNPVGQFLDRSPGTERAEVVGVVNDTVWDTPKMCIYRPVSRNERSKSIVLVRASENPVAVMGSIRRSVLSIRNDLQPRISRLQTNIDDRLRGSKADATVWGTLAILALALATVGIYGVVNYATSQRIREIGIRMALGATPREILQVLVFGGLRPVLIGCALGVTLAALASRFFVSRLHGLSPLDPGIYLTVSLFIGSVALLSAYLPARRAARTDPLQALRHS